MPITRVIYTQGAVNIKAPAGVAWFTDSMTGTNGLFLSGVQSASFTCNTPRVGVNSFGVLGSVNRIQVEPQTATLEVNIMVNSGNMTSPGATSDKSWFSGLATDTIQPLPSGVTVTASGIGQVSGAVLTSIRLEAAVGAVPTLALTFDGYSGAPQTAGAAPSTPNTASYPVVTPDSFGTLYWINQSASGCPMSVRANWEMPVERINCLGNPINSPTIFSRPPGTLSFTAEGCDPAFIAANNYLTGLQVGPYKITQFSGSIKESSRSANVAVGEANATFNVTSEGVAIGASFAG